MVDIPPQGIEQFLIDMGHNPNKKRTSESKTQESKDEEAKQGDEELGDRFTQSLELL